MNYRRKLKIWFFKDSIKFNQQIITLRGFAGTGKTFTASKIISELKENIKRILEHSHQLQVQCLI